MPEASANAPERVDTGIEVATEADAVLPETPNTALESAATRSDMLEAAAAARKEFEEAAAGKAKAATPAAATPAASPAAPLSPTEAAVEKAMAAREAKQEELWAARREAEQIRAEAKAEHARMVAEARAAAAAELETARKRLREDPAGLIKEAGWEPVGLMRNLAEDGTPTAIAQRQLLALQHQIAELQKERAEEKSQAEQARQRAAAEAEQRNYEENGRKFVEQFFTDARPILKPYAKHPTLARALVLEAAEEANRIARKEGGIAPSWDRLADFLEQKYRSDDVPAAAPSSAQPPTQGKTVTRAPSQQQASERRVAPKDWSQMTPEEQKRVQLEDLAAVRAKHARGEPVGDD